MMMITAVDSLSLMMIQTKQTNIAEACLNTETRDLFLLLRLLASSHLAAGMHGHCMQAWLDAKLPHGLNHA
jgi:hypothetical protein